MPLSIEADSGFGCTGRSTTAPFFEALETESIQPFPLIGPSRVAILPNMLKIKLILLPMP
jgi:hypothetical protein